MIRVGFMFASADTSWLGGMSYYRNLFSAIREMPERKIDPVLITSRGGVNTFRSQFPGIEVIHLPLLDAPRIVGKSRRAVQLLTGRDFPLEYVLRAHDIDLLSHSGYFGKRSAIPSIAWIPDFQELSFPEFFSPAELASRGRNVVNACRHASTLLLSSEAALADLHRTGTKAGMTAVLPFVAAVPPQADLLSRDEVESSYRLGGKFFHMPNQFWIHKNHLAVIEALAVLHRQGTSFNVIATGNTNDPRQPGHFASLVEAARKNGVEHLFRTPGVVPYRDLMSLMRHAVAVINPSKFEGWSTTVEEAKSMGKAILLSDIPVHREQAPERATFFPPGDARKLADAMAEAWENWNPDTDSRFVEAAASSLPARRRDFARRYEDIVLATLAAHTGGRTRRSAAGHGRRN